MNHFDVIKRNLSRLPVLPLSLRDILRHIEGLYPILRVIKFSNQTL